MGQFVGVGDGVNRGTSYILTSSNGLDWTSQTVPTTNRLLADSPALDYDGTGWASSLYVAVGENGTIVGTTNEWTKPTSGNWEEPFWSLGVLPGPGQSIKIGNPGWKAVAIGNSTVVSHPSSLTVEAVEVSSPVDTFNTLLLNYAGLAVPLRIATDLRVGTNAALVSFSSGLQGANFYLGGTATFAEQSQASFSGQVAVGVNGAAQLNVSNSVLNAGYLSLNLPATGGVAVVNLNGGSVVSSNAIDIGSGNIFMSGGHLRSPGITVFEGELHQSGGTNETGLIRWPDNRQQPGQANYYLSGGTLLSGSLLLGAGTPGGFAGLNGVFEQSGGVHSNSGGIVIWGTVRSTGGRPNGSYHLMNGLLVTPSLRQVEGGGFEQSGGTNRAGIIAVGDTALFMLSGGSLSSSNFSVASQFGDARVFRNFRSFYTQTGGTHVVQGVFGADLGGVAQLLGGWLTATDIRVSGELELSGAPVTNSETFTIQSGAQIRPAGNYEQLGKLIVETITDPNRGPLPPPYVDFAVSAATLRFQDSHDAAWDSGEILEITNWAGSLGGGGADRIYVGTSAQGLSPAQLSRVIFRNPAGLPAGSYSARILGTGELVPSPRPTLSYMRTASGFTLTWGDGYDLYSATNISGPWAPVAGAESPHTIEINTAEPQRYFQLRSSAP